MTGLLIKKCCCAPGEPIPDTVCPSCFLYLLDMKEIHCAGILLHLFDSPSAPLTADGYVLSRMVECPEGLYLTLENHMTVTIFGEPVPHNEYGMHGGCNRPFPGPGYPPNPPEWPAAWRIVVGLPSSVNPGQPAVGLHYVRPHYVQDPDDEGYPLTGPWFFLGARRSGVNVDSWVINEGSVWIQEPP